MKSQQKVSENSHFTNSNVEKWKIFILIEITQKKREQQQHLSQSLCLNMYTRFYVHFRHPNFIPKTNLKCLNFSWKKLYYILAKKKWIWIGEYVTFLRNSLIRLSKSHFHMCFLHPLIVIKTKAKRELLGVPQAETRIIYWYCLISQKSPFSLLPF